MKKNLKNGLVEFLWINQQFDLALGSKTKRS